MKEFKNNSLLMFLLFSLVSINAAAADTIINNYQSGPPQPQQQPMPPPQYNQAPMSYSTSPTPPGTYQTKNADGSYSTVYTTGDKQPYIVDNPAPQSQPIIQPYVYPNMPTNTGGYGPQPQPQQQINRPLR